MKSIRFDTAVKSRTLPSSALFRRVFSFVFLIIFSIVSCTTEPPVSPQPVKKEKQETAGKRAEEPEPVREEKKAAEVPEASLPEDLQAALHSAVLAEDYKEAERLLHAGADIDGIGPDGWTVLMHVLDDPELGLSPVRFILEKGGTINYHIDWISPVYLAAVRGKEESLCHLREEGGNVDLVVEEERNVLMQVISAPQVKKKDKIRAVNLLLDEGADPNWQDQNNQTPLILTIQTHQSPTIVQFLLEKGAKPNLRGPEKLTPLMAAALASSPKAVVTYLLEAGGDLTMELPGRSNAMDMALAGLNMEFLSAVRDFEGP
jgi:ankyrin repeat protein